MRLRLDERDQVLKLTHPPRMRASAALDWAAGQRAWVDEQLRCISRPEPFVPGALIPVDGREVELRWSANLPRAPRLVDGSLGCGGPADSFARRIEEFLRRCALETLSRETAEVASRCGLRASAVSVGDPRARWGSCSSGGRIRYSWRLILAHPDARRFVVAHEVAHLKHLDHGAAFKALERELFGGDTASAQALLRASAPRLRRIGLTR
jgi:predicted metal-dependent hydrolase